MLLPRHISQTVNVCNTSHLGPPYSTSEVTLHCSLPRHHHFTPPHLKAHVPHHKATVHVSHHSTSTTILHHTHIQHHSILHTTTYSTSHYTTTSRLNLHHTTTSDNTLHHFPHLTSHNNHSTLHMPHSSSPHFHTTTPISHHIVTFHTDFALCNIPHTRTPHSTPRHIPHHTFCISITPCLKLQHSTSVAPHFTYTDITSHHNSHQSNHPTTSQRTIPHHAHIPPHTTPCTSPHSNINCTIPQHDVHLENV